jgi:predicted RNase H-like HicB family nuclease
MDDITEALKSATKTWSWIVMTAAPHGHYAFGNSRAEALANLKETCGCTDDDEKRVGEFSGPVKVVVDVFGRIWWDDGDVSLTWEADR